MIEKKVPVCVVTGQPAHYRDPHTFAPYSTIAAFKTLQKVYHHEFIWNEALEAYTGQIGVGVEKDIEAEVEATEKEMKRIKAMNLAREKAERIKIKEEAALALLEGIQGEIEMGLLPALPDLLPALPELGSRRKSTNGNGNSHSNGNGNGNSASKVKGKRVVRVYDEMSESNSDTPSPKPKGRGGRKSVSRASKKDDSEFDPKKFGHD